MCSFLARGQRAGAHGPIYKGNMRVGSLSCTGRQPPNETPFMKKSSTMKYDAEISAREQFHFAWRGSCNDESPA
jgi:hypothetical protein